MKPYLTCDRPARTPQARYCEACAKEHKRRSNTLSKQKNDGRYRVHPITFGECKSKYQAAARRLGLSFPEFVRQACAEKAEKVAPLGCCPEAVPYP